VTLGAVLPYAYGTIMAELRRCCWRGMDSITTRG